MNTQNAIRLYTSEYSDPFGPFLPIVGRKGAKEGCVWDRFCVTEARVSADCLVVPEAAARGLADICRATGGMCVAGLAFRGTGIAVFLEKSSPD
ncbi:MAG: hypothetical protein LBD72_01390 [Puniceicoccales bacterium]|jgi:hypothetical protein|nr:hypothetical protein [Puniceicoccales bacterium]